MKKLALLLSLAFLFAACPDAALAAADKGEVVVYNWSEYIPQDVLDEFTDETGIKVVYSTYETNDAMYSKIKLLRGQSYDLVCPSTYYLHLMIEEGLVTTFDHAKLTNLGNLDPKLMAPPYDPENKFSIPYMWGSFGMIINTKYVDREKAKTWRDLLRPEYKGKVILSDDMRDTFGIAMHAAGKSANSTNPDDIKAGYEFLKELHPSVRVFDLTAVKQAFISEEVIIGTSFNGDALVAKQEHPDLEYIYPEDGALVWIDSFAIPVGAKNVDNAHEFVNFLLRPEIAKRCQEEFMYSTPNLGTIELMSPEERNNPALQPTDKDLQKAEYLLNVGSKTLMLYKDYWEKLKSGF
ncbi:MAG: spermidine/putrescine ABC transporter substrate-binding protein [Deltaproteobacteria bacterium]|jgi:spermidine/putrescine transport system substrate-binding protein|nr:spermidine/putrescine ABC transporter substrate-binding protein [Deltaproteobacteria bacterium]